MDPLGEEMIENDQNYAKNMKINTFWNFENTQKMSTRQDYRVEKRENVNKKGNPQNQKHKGGPLRI